MMTDDGGAQGWRHWLALLLSVVFSPFVCAPAFCWLYASALARSPEEFRRLALACVFFSIFVPAAYIGWNVWRGRISDLHVSNLTQRHKPFQAGLAGLGMLTVYLYATHSPAPLTRLSFAIFCQGWLFDFISRTWKISLHTGVLAACLVGCIHINSWNPLCLLLLLPLAWARAFRKRHLLSQALAGAGLGILGTALLLDLLGP
jgi:hypothetical protein